MPPLQFNFLPNITDKNLVGDAARRPEQCETNRPCNKLLFVEKNSSKNRRGGNLPPAQCETTTTNQHIK